MLFLLKISNLQHLFSLKIILTVFSEEGLAGSATVENHSIGFVPRN